MQLFRSLPPRSPATQRAAPHADARVAQRAQPAEHARGAAPAPLRAARPPARSGFLGKALCCLSVSIALVACDDTDESPVATDLGAPLDGATADAAPSLDAAPSDASPPADASPAPDAEAQPDAAPDMTAGDTWANYAQAWIATYCVECHAGGPRDYRTLDDVIRDQHGIRCGVAPERAADCVGFPPPGQFPVGNGPKPDEAERRRLVAWIEAGLPE